MSVSLLQQLAAHLAWADSELLDAVAAAPEACSDPRLLGILHHIVFVERFFTALLTGTAFNLQQESQPAEALAGLQSLHSRTQFDLLLFTNDLKEELLSVPVENPWAPDLRGTVAQILLQIVLHSQNHRGQCLARLREVTGNAPTLDFIVWLKLGRPAPLTTHASG